MSWLRAALASSRIIRTRYVALLAVLAALFELGTAVALAGLPSGCETCDSTYDQPAVVATSLGSFDVGQRCGYDEGANPAGARSASAPSILAAKGGTAARGVPRPVSGGAPNLADLPANARTTGCFNEVARRLGKNHGIDRATASERLHKIKSEMGRGPADNVIFDLTGNVYDPRTGEYLGSLTQGGARRVGRP